jgi:hypothetical protein
MSLATLLVNPLTPSREYRLDEKCGSYPYICLSLGYRSSHQDLQETAAIPRPQRDLLAPYPLLRRPRPQGNAPAHCFGVAVSEGSRSRSRDRQSGVGASSKEELHPLLAKLVAPSRGGVTKKNNTAIVPQDLLRDTLWRSWTPVVERAADVQSYRFARIQKLY